MTGRRPTSPAWLRWALPLAVMGLGLANAVLGAGVSARAPVAAGAASWPGGAVSSAIAVTSDGATLLVANPDANTVTLVDTATQLVSTEVAVGTDPRALAISPDDATAYVACQGSDHVAVVDLAAHVATPVAVGSRPVGVAISPDGRLIAVAEHGDDQVRFLDALSLRTLSAQAVADRPYGLAFTPDGRRLLVTHLHSGDVSLLPVRPWVLRFPLLAKLSAIRSPHAPASGAERLVPPHLASGIRLPASSSRRPASSIQHPVTSSRQQASGIQQPASVQTWPNVAPAPAVIVNAAGTCAYLPQTMANGLQLNTGFDTTVFPKVSVLDLDTDSHARSEHIPLPEVDRPVGLPWAAALAKSDTELWVVNAGSNDVSVLDLSTPVAPRTAAHLSVGDNPRGIVISTDGTRAYVNNALAGTVNVIDTAAYTVTATITVTDIPLPPTLLHGKRLFHASARPDLAKAAWISCNTCHIEGEHDSRTWLLQYTGEVPPGASATITRNTTSLLGMAETYPLRWSAEWDESADSEFSVRFEQFGTGLIDGEMHPTLGPLNQGRSHDLDCLAAFIDGLLVPDRTQPLTAGAARGRAVFESPATGCAGCHPAPLYTDLQVHDVGTADAYGEWFGPLIDTPTLRFLNDSAPYLHDGSAATLYDVLVSANPVDEHGVTSHLTPHEIEDLIAFMLALPHEE